ncbi:helix-turn-helix domain-containing protein [Enhygromyxa salina]
MRSLRRARGFTQEILAERSGLSPDTVRRLENGGLSPSLDTLDKLARGLRLQMSTLFVEYELGVRDVRRELLDLVAGRPECDHELAMQLLEILFETLEALWTDATSDEGMATTMDKADNSSSFGAHVKRLREVRRMTQEELAARSGLAADTIRRLEHQDFSPSLRTLRKVCKGLGLSVAAMFVTFELEGVPEDVARITGLLIGRSAVELGLLERVLAALIEELEHRGSSARADESPSANPR